MHPSDSDCVQTNSVAMARHRTLKERVENERDWAIKNLVNIQKKLEIINSLDVATLAKFEEIQNL